MLNRSITAYQACDPQAVASGSKAQMANFVEDAKADIAMLARALQLCQRTFANLIRPDAIRDTSALHAFAQVVEAESAARHALAGGREYEQATTIQKITADGTLLNVHLSDGSKRVWDVINNASDRGILRVLVAMTNQFGHVEVDKFIGLQYPDLKP